MTITAKMAKQQWYSTKGALLISGLMAGMLLLSACGGGTNAINGRKTSPDEFEVVIRPPLTLPPNFSLRPGDTNDEEIASGQAQNALTSNLAISQSQQLLSTSSADASNFDELFGTNRAIKNIRAIIDEETLGIQLDRRIPLEELFGGKPEVGPDLNAEAEAFRIRQAVKDGQPLTITPTPGIDPIEKEPLEIE